MVAGNDHLGDSAETTAAGIVSRAKGPDLVTSYERVGVGKQVGCHGRHQGSDCGLTDIIAHLHVGEHL